jgi:hypothetical protein
MKMDIDCCFSSIPVPLVTCIYSTAAKQLHGKNCKQPGLAFRQAVYQRHG